MSLDLERIEPLFDRSGKEIYSGKGERSKKIRSLDRTGKIFARKAGKLVKVNIDEWEKTSKCWDKQDVALESLEILRKNDSKYDTIFVDEVQDLDHGSLSNSFFYCRRR